MDDKKLKEWLEENKDRTMPDNGLGAQLVLMHENITRIALKMLGIKSPSEENRRHFSNMYSSIKNDKKNNNKKTRLRQ